MYDNMTLSNTNTSITNYHPRVDKAFYSTFIIVSVDSGQCVHRQIWLRTEVFVPEMNKQVKLSPKGGKVGEAGMANSADIWVRCKFQISDFSTSDMHGNQKFIHITFVVYKYKKALE